METLKFHCKQCKTISHANSMAHIHQLGKLCANCRSEANRDKLRHLTVKEKKAKGLL